MGPRLGHKRNLRSSENIREMILAEVHTWGVIAPTRASAIVSESLDALDDAITEIAPPKGVSDGMSEHMQWNVRRLLAGQEISEPRA